MQSKRYSFVLSFLTMLAILFSYTGQAQIANAYLDSGLVVPTVTSDKDDYAPGEIAHITGIGWVLDKGTKSVHVEFKEEPDYPDFHIYDVNVDENGNWSIDYLIESRHLGVRFTVVAVGKQSGYQASAIFTDGFSLNQISPTTVCSGGQITVKYNANTGGGLPTAPYKVQLSDGAGSFNTPIELGQTSLSGNNDFIVTIPTGTTPGPGYKIRMISSDPSPIITLSQSLTVNGSIGGTISSNQTICSGSTPGNLTLSGHLGTIVKWQKSSDPEFLSPVDIANASATLTGTTIGSLSATTYFRAVVKNGSCASVNSSAVMITVNQKSSDPVSATASLMAICSGQNTVLTLNGGGGGVAETIKWYTGSCGSVLVGSGNNLTVNPTTTTTYYGRYENGSPCNLNTVCKSVTITVIQSTKIEVNPTTISPAITYGSDATFTVGASGSNLKYQWQVSTGGSFSNIDGATDATLTLVKPTVSKNGYQYRCMVTGDCGVEPSGAASLNITRADQTITISQSAPSSASYNSSFTVAATASSGLAVSYSSTGSVSNSGATYTMSSGTGTGTVTYTQAGNDNYNSVTTTETVTAAKASATVALSNLTGHVFDGSPRAAVATTGPTGLTVDLTYNASGTIPVNAGAYNVVATINDPNYAGSATGTLKIDKATPEISWSNPSKITYGTALSATQLNATSGGVTGTFTYSPAAGAVLNAGTGQTLSVTFTPADLANYNTPAAKTVSLDVDKATATITLSDLIHTYDGSPKAVVTTTAPAGLTVDVTYNGIVTNPVNANSYTVVGTINDANYTGTATGTFKIDKATPQLTWSNPENIPYGTLLGGTQLNATAGVPGSFIYSPASGTKLNAGDAQTLSVNFTPDDVSNYNTTSKTVNINVQKASLAVIVNDKTRKYDLANPALDGTISGVIAGDGITASYSTTAAQTSNIGDYPISATLNDPNNKLANYSVAITPGKLTITPADATITLSDLDKTYNGAEQGATVTTAPLGLAVNVTYNGAAAVPVNAGPYNVSVKLNNNNYTAATATGTLVIAKADQTISISQSAPSSAVYNTTFTVAATASSGLQVTYSSTGSVGNSGATFTMTSGTGTGTVTYTQAGNDNYNSATETETVTAAKASATVTLSNLTGHVYDGNVKAATATTNPADLTVAITYNGESTAPANANSYSVVASINDPNYAGSATGTLKIDKATPEISWSNPSKITYGTALSATQLNATSGGVTGTFSYSPGEGFVLNAGTGQILSATFTPADVANYNIPVAKTVNIDVDKATATITLTELSHTYNGSPKAAVATPNPAGLKVDLTYDGSETKPVNAGSYNVVATINDPNYTGEKTGDLEIAKATPVIEWENPASIIYGTALGSGQLNATSGGVTGTFTYTPAAGSILNAGENQNLTVSFTPADNQNYNTPASKSVSIDVAKATATISLSGLNPTYDGNPKLVTATTTPVNLTGISITYDGSSNAPVDAGTYAIVASLDNPNYTAADATNDLVIKKASQTISIQTHAPANAIYNSKFTVEATASSGLTVEIAATGKLVLNGTEFTMTSGTGSGAVTFNQPGNNNYEAATEIVEVVNAQKASQTITFNALADKTYGDDAFAIAASASSDLPVTFTIDNHAVYDAITGKVTIQSAGEVTITASQAGDDNYAAAANLPQSFTINKGAANVSVQGYTGIFDANAHGASLVSVKDAYGNDLPSGLVTLGSSFTNVPGGTANWTFVGDDNHESSNGSVAITISQASNTISFGALEAKKYGNADFTLSATSSSGLPVTYAATGDATVTGNVVRITGAGGATITASQTGNGNYKAATDVSHSFTIEKADAVINVSGFTGTYDGQAHGATGTAAGVKGENLNSALHLGQTFTNATEGSTVNWTFDGDANHKNASGSVTIVINKAKPAITLTIGDAPTYDGNAHYVEVATVSGVTINGKAEELGKASVAYTQNNTPVSEPTDAGDYDVIASYTGSANYEAASPETGILTIIKANATITVTGYSGVYDGKAHGATGTVIGVKDLALDGLDLGASFTNVPGGTANWKFNGGNNYNNAEGSVNIAIGKATPVITLTIGNAPTFNGEAHYINSATVAGVDNTSLGNATVVYKQGGNVVTNPVNAGSYDVVATFAASDNYEAAAQKTGTLVINKANATVEITNYDGIYDGKAHTASGKVTGVINDDLTSQLSFGSSFTNASDNTTTWSFNGGINYNDQNGNATVKIAKANQDITWDDPAAIVYGTTLGASQLNATVAGVSGGSAPGSLTYSPVSGTVLDAGAQILSVKAAETQNYKEATKTVNITINQAKPTIVLELAPTYTYTGNQQGATKTTITGVGEEVLGKTISYVGINATQYPSSATPPVNAGDYKVTLTFDGSNMNYEAASESANYTIAKANAIFDMKGYSGTYDGNSHAATGAATGVKSEDLSSLLTFGSGYTNVPGGNATWSFAGNGNYNSANGEEAITLAQATPVVTLTVNNSFVFNNTPQGATVATIIGVKNENLGTVLYTGTGSTSYSNTAAPTNAGSYNVSVSFDGNTNYLAASDSKNFTIGKATPTIDITVGGPYTYNSAAQSISAAVVKGVGSATLGNAAVVYEQNGAQVTPLDAGTYTAVASFAGDNNYNSVVNNTKTLVINKANAAIVITPYNGIYDGDKHTVYGTAKGVNNVDLTSSLTIDPGYINVPGGSVNWTFNGGTNYNNANGTSTVTITPQTANPVGDAFYTGSSFYWTTGSTSTTTTSSTATLTLAATIKNNVNFTGDIRTAKVSFFIRNGDGSRTPINGAQNLPVGLVNPGDLSVGSSAVNVQYNIGSAAATTLNIGVLVSGNYKSNPSDLTLDNTITIAKPTPGGLIVGAGYVSNATAAGYIKGAPNKKAKFDFYVQYNKSLKNPQGGVEITVKSYNDRNGNPTQDLHTYKFKSNAISVLSVTSPTAQFTSKANVSEVFADGHIEAIEGNCTMQMDMTDAINTGIGDKIGITIYRSKGGIWYSSNWDGTKTQQAVVVNEGTWKSELSVTGSGGTSSSVVTARTIEAQVEVQPVTQQFNLSAFPNPSTSQFTIKLESNTTDPITLRVSDLTGRVVRLIHGLTAGQTLQLGNEYRPGVYFVEMIQGANRKQLKLIKQHN